LWNIADKYIIIMAGVLMKLRYIFIGFVVLLLAAGCAKLPQAEMDSAKEAVFRAENDENAVLYGASSLARARDALRRMQVEADSKRYEAAKTHAAEAIAAAERAITDGQAAAVRAKTESESMIAGLKPVVEETERNLNGARYNQLNLDYNQLNTQLNTARDSVDAAEVDIARGKYQDALDKGRTARATLGDINERISSATPRRKS
jgi:hypothetical protein